jgi:formate dehydrogenase maturation protein FdhE
MSRDQDRSVSLEGLLLRDLCEWHEVRAECLLCRHGTDMPLWRLRKGRSPDTPVLRLAQKLRCVDCDARLATITVRKMER